MWEKIHPLLLAYQDILIALTMTASLIIAAMVWWDEVKYFLLRASYGLPVLGKISRAGVRHLHVGKDRWFPIQKELCASFYKYYSHFNQSPDYYDKCEDYLSKAQELGRRKKGPMLWTLIIGLILLEAVGFAYVLVPFMANDTSSNERVYLAWAIALVLSVASVILTELAGRELHKNGLVNKITTWRRHDENPCSLSQDPQVKLATSYRDQEKPNYVQLLNRVDANANVTPSYVWSVCALLFVVAIATGAFMIRAKTYEAMQTDAINNPYSRVEAMADMADSAEALLAKAEEAAKAQAAASEDAIELPDDAVANNKAADAKAKTEAEAAKKGASLTTYIILSIIYLAIQGTSVYFGFAFSLVGKESVKAYEYTKDFNSSEELATWLASKREQLARDAESYLSALNNRLKNLPHTGKETETLNLPKSFYDYVNEATERSAKGPRTEQGLSKGSAPVPAPVAAASPAMSPAAEVPTAFDAPAPRKLERSHLGDLTSLSAEELEFLAEDEGMALELLQKEQRRQCIRQKTQAGNPA